MSDELVLTSVPHGLRAGSVGFCEVAQTRTLGPAWIERLRSLSNAVTNAGDPTNAVTFAHARLTVAGQTRSVLTRTAPSGVDYSGRPNRIVHHLLLADHERPVGGPAWVMRRTGIMRADWDGEPRIVDERPPLPADEPSSAPAVTWLGATGDAGWAGLLATHAAQDPARIITIVTPPRVDRLALADEAIRLLPPPRRWDVTFSTHFTDAPAGVACAWRFVIAGSAAATQARGVVLDLARLDPHELPRSPFVEAARSGQPIRHPARTAPVRPAPIEVAEPHDPPAPAAPQPVLSVATEMSHAHGIGFWLLVIGLPAALLGIAAILLLSLSAKRRDVSTGPSRSAAGFSYDLALPPLGTAA